MENTDQRKLMNVPELLTVWGLAFAGSTLGSLVVGILGVALVYFSYPDVEFEHGAAVVGAVFGSSLRIPFGFFAGGLTGVLTYNFLSKRKSRRPLLFANVAAIVTGALASGLSLIPVGFVFFGLGHI